MPPISFVVDRRDSGRTLAAVLKDRLGLTWSQAKRLVASRHVRVGQQVETDVARRLKPGKRIQLDAGSVEQPKREKPPVKPIPTTRGPKRDRSPVSRDPKRSAGERAPEITIDIVYADDAIAVVNKPAGLTTMRHAAEAAEFGRGQRFLPATLADQLPALLGTPDRPVIAVHRIDRDTSGLVAFARTPAAARALARQFRNHTVERRYLALIRGMPESSRIESILVRDRGDGRRGSTRKSNPPDGKTAITHVKRLEVLGEFAAIECRLETGRTHQVRIHLGEAGTPLCGERVYDRPVNGRPMPDNSGAKRPMLHAASLGFIHPETGEAMRWEVKPPADFAAIWADLRSRA
ncbi:MAG TPA: RluA family pseudouridine synthase [Gemmataceae bacterium]|jgi:23S rRNA pseudouridine1911/1915/1917 synthase